ncbi:MAG: recombinase family protein [Bacteroidota bacterium]
MTKVIIYVRVSTDEQAAHGYSIDDQIARLEQYCKINNYEVVKVVKEDYSAKTFDRPAFKEVLSFIKSNKGVVDLLLVLKWDRFSRNATDALSMIRTLSKMHVSVNAAEQPIDLKIPENKLMLSFYVTAPEVENDRRSLNVIKGMRRANFEGRYLGKAPRGYSNKTDATEKPIIVPNETAPLVKEAFGMMATGLYTQPEVLKLLKEKGFKCEKSQFCDLLHNRLYAGKVFVKADGDEPEQWVNGLHESLITEEIFQRVQDVMNERLQKRNRPKPQKQNGSLPLRSFLICPECGRKLTGSKSKGNGGWYFYYHCNPCKVRFKADFVNGQLEKMIESVQIDPDVQEMYLAVIKDLLNESEIARKNDLGKRGKEINLLEERIQNLTDLLADGKMESVDYAQAKKRYQGNINKLNWESNQLKMVKTEFDKYLSWGFCLMKDIKEYYCEAPIDVKQKIIGSIYSNSFNIEGGILRTKKMNSLVALIANSNKGLSETKNGQLQDFEKLSALVPGAGIEPARV